MDIQQQQQGAVTVIKPMGPITQADAAQFKTAVMEAVNRSLGRILVDASAVSFADSRGLEVLVDLTEHLGHSGRSLKLCGATDTLREALDLIGWAEEFEQFDDVTSGVRSFL